MFHYCENKLFLFLLTANSPRGVDPDDANVAEENTLLVFLVLAGTALLSPVGRVGELLHGALLRCGARNREGRGWKTKVEVVRNFIILVCNGYMYSVIMRVYFFFKFMFRKVSACNVPIKNQIIRCKILTFSFHFMWLRTNILWGPKQFS